MWLNYNVLQYGTYLGVLPYYLSFPFSYYIMMVSFCDQGRTKGQNIKVRRTRHSP